MTQAEISGEVVVVDRAGGFPVNGRHPRSPGFALALCLCLVLGSAGLLPRWVTAAEPINLDRLTTEYQRVLEQIVEETDVPGGVAAFVLPDGRMGRVSAGLADAETKELMRPESRLLSGSIGKTFVGALSLKLALEGVLDLDAPISRWLGDKPWFQQLKSGELMTLRQLLQHRSGLIDHVHVKAFNEAFVTGEMSMATGASPEQLIAFVLDADLLFPPGQGYSYSDTGYLLAGLIIEQATGSTYYELLRTHFLDPLELLETSPSNDRRLAGLVPGYLESDYLGEGLKTMKEPGVLFYNPATEWTGGGLVTNAGDLARWGKLLYEGKAMEGEYLFQLLGSAPLTKGNRYSAYGLGQGISQTSNGVVYGHSGWIPGYVSFMGYFPDHQVAVAAQFNSNAGHSTGAGPIGPAKERLAATVISALDGSGVAGTDPAKEESAQKDLLAFRANVLSAKAAQDRITTPNGIDVLEPFRINGIDQWVSIRGDDKDNPVLLYLHGGPGSVTMPFSNLLPKAWEENFTMVHWDQRGTGKTRCANPQYDAAQATYEDFYSDTVAMVNTLRERFHKDKIIVFGHSWGSILGLHLAREHPELLHAYVGTGQVINAWKGEIVGYRFLLDEARRRNDYEALTALEALAPYPSEQGMDQKMNVQRHYMQAYGGSIRGDLSYTQLFELAFFESPLYSVCDWMGFVNTVFLEDPHKKIRDAIVQEESPIANFDLYPSDYDIPIFFFLGAHDLHTPTAVVADYFEKVHAPYKKLILFEDSAHAAPMREKDKFIQAMIEYVRPLAHDEKRQ